MMWETKFVFSFLVGKTMNYEYVHFVGFPIDDVTSLSGEIEC